MAVGFCRSLARSQQPGRNQLIDFVLVQLNWDGSQPSLPQVAVPTHAFGCTGRACLHHWV